jgi:hypothetical protein
LADGPQGMLCARTRPRPSSLAWRCPQQLPSRVAKAVKMYGKPGRWLLIAVIIYLLPGLALAVWAQLLADLSDPPPMPVWAPSLSLGQRVAAALWMLPTVLLWPVFLPPTIYWCFIRGACG